MLHLHIGFGTPEVNAGRKRSFCEIFVTSIDDRHRHGVTTSWQIMRAHVADDVRYVIAQRMGTALAAPPPQRPAEVSLAVHSPHAGGLRIE